MRTDELSTVGQTGQKGAIFKKYPFNRNINNRGMETDGSGGRVARVRVRAVGMAGVGWGGGV